MTVTVSVNVTITVTVSVDVTMTVTVSVDVTMTVTVSVDVTMTVTVSVNVSMTVTESVNVTMTVTSRHAPCATLFKVNSARDLLPIGIPEYVYEEEGDVTLGCMIPLHRFSSTSLCDEDLNAVPPWTPAFYTFKHAVDLINSNSTLLPAYLPDVVGIVGDGRSHGCIQMAPLLMLYEVPQISYWATNDILSDRARYSFFYRTVLPDNDRIRTMMDVVSHFGWTYISLLYQDDPHGHNALKGIKRLAAERDICLAVTRMVEWSMDNEEDYIWLAQELIDNWNARVVLTYLFEPFPHGIIRALQTLGAENHFIFFASDTWAQTTDEFKEIRTVAQGVFGFDTYANQLADFRDYFRTLSLETEKHNPWFVQYLESYQNCSIDASSDRPCSSTDLFKMYPELPNVAYFIIDPVFVFAQAIHNIRETQCPGAIGFALRQCITGPLISQQLNYGQFNSPAGNSIIFDAVGNVKGKISIRKFTKTFKINNANISGTNNSASDYEMVGVGYWDVLTKSLNMNDDNIHWPKDHTEEGPPESICSKPCPERFYKIQLELPCCWECRSCRINEYLLENRTDCLRCPLYSWPDELHGTTCALIPVTYIQWGDALAVLLTTIAVVGFIGTTVIGVLFIKVAFSVAWAVIHPPGAELQMRIPTEKLVELSCKTQTEGFLTSLSFNVLLTVFCRGYKQF
ncbi:PREDICTED: metabotropic glutamate receptor 5-like [Priapulus caudatus]|uniref:Metabotropic glutamate receptor 5-like n=1 Tax=Priapulus caudatus TaxID=37621 RepID=A0ABM1F072_PRICU|nr:PREDICTED: metabotropic glutamate receptor 5-like [Priapulus caudatus]